MTNIDQLEQLTKELNFSELIISHTEETFLVKGHVGKVTAYTLFKDDKISIAKSYGLKGTILPYHKHSGKEWFGVFSGKVKIDFDDGESIIVNAGEGYEIKEGRAHNCSYIESSWMWLVTMPPEFP